MRVSVFTSSSNHQQQSQESHGVWWMIRRHLDIPQHTFISVQPLSSTCPSSLPSFCWLNLGPYNVCLPWATKRQPKSNITYVSYLVWVLVFSWVTHSWKGTVRKQWKQLYNQWSMIKKNNFFVCLVVFWGFTKRQGQTKRHCKAFYESWFGQKVYLLLHGCPWIKARRGEKKIICGLRKRKLEHHAICSFSVSVDTFFLF